MTESEQPPSITQVLSAVLAHDHGATDGKVSLNDLGDALGHRAFGILYLLFGLPNCFPMPPGIPILCGIVIFVVSLQMLLGEQTLVLPKWLGERRIDRAMLAKVIEKSTKWLGYLERLSKSRYPFLSGDIMRRAIGAAGCALAIALMAPIPLVGGIPAGLAVTILGLAFAQRDGILIGFGIVIATPVALAVTSAMMFALVQGAAAVF